jgi:trans-aconitate 2-methyltransferase
MYTWNPQDYAQHSRGQEAWAKELLAQVELRADDVVLDVGCGDGRNTAAIAASVPNGRVLGVDLSADMVAHAAIQHCRPSANNLRFAQADAGALPFEAEFSVVFSNATLHWVPTSARPSRASRERCDLAAGSSPSSAAKVTVPTPLPPSRSLPQTCVGGAC